MIQCLLAKTRYLEMIEPLHFGGAGRQIFGLFHPGTSAGGRRAAVLLCNPFGQEAIRAHRTLRSLADRLARLGHPVLRFDYFGTGDSMGDDADVLLSGCVADVLAADDLLAARSGATSTVWVGMRLGGTVAMQAAAKATKRLERLVLWDPILDGRRYLALLRDKHVASLEAAFSLTPTPAPGEVARDPSAYRDEACGFDIPVGLRHELEGLDAAGARWPDHPPAITAVFDPNDPVGLDVAALMARQPGRASAMHASHGIDWNADSMDEGALVPGQAMLLLAQAVEAA